MKMKKDHMGLDMNTIIVNIRVLSASDDDAYMY